MAVLVRAVTYATLFIGLVLVYLPARMLAVAGVTRPARYGVSQMAGTVVGAAGAALVVWCILSFALIGHGTPAAFDPPRRLVVRGPYRYVRNPMYLGAGLALAGAALFYEAIALWAYAAAFLLLLHLFVIWYEEPTLRRTFGEDYEQDPPAGPALVAGSVKPYCNASIRGSSMNLLGAAAVVVVLLTSVLSTSAAQSRGEIRVWTARAIATVLAEIGPEFERATGYRLTVTSDLPPAFLRRARAGEPFDVIISGSATVDEWIRDGRIAAATRTTIARSGIGVEVRAGAPRPDISSLEALKRTLLEAKSIAYLRVWERHSCRQPRRTPRDCRIDRWPRPRAPNPTSCPSSSS